MNSPTAEKPKISLVCPVYNEEDIISLYYERFQKATSCLRDRYSIEMIFVNNCSSDDTLAIARDLHSHDSSVQVISLTRNFGYQASVLCGLTFATGEAIVVNDVDCEDPPELISRFVEKWEEGNDIIYGIRKKRPEFWGLVLCRKLFYRLTRAIADHDFILDMAEFSLITRRVRDEVITIKTTFPFIRNELGYVGFRQAGISYDREKRIGGKSHYNLARMTKFAIAGILTASTFPLRLTAYLAAPLFLLNLFAIAFCFLSPGSLPLEFIFLLNSLFLISSVTFLSTYMARIYKNGIQRPVFIIDWKNTILNSRPVD